MSGCRVWPNARPSPPCRRARPEDGQETAFKCFVGGLVSSLQEEDLMTLFR